VQPRRDEPAQPRRLDRLARGAGGARQDRHAPLAGDEAPGGRQNVPQGRRGTARPDGGGGEGRVRENDVREHVAAEQVVDVLGVMPGDRGPEQRLRDRGAERVELVRDDVTASVPRHVGERAGPCCGLQGDEARADRGGHGRDMRAGQGDGELLQFDCVSERRVPVARSGVGGGGQFHNAAGRAGAVAVVIPVRQDRGRLHEVVGLTPAPGTGGVASTGHIGQVACQRGVRGIAHGEGVAKAGQQDRDVAALPGGSPWT
jgi:hypothetical protein